MRQFPRDIAQRSRASLDRKPKSDTFRRETFALPRTEARAKAAELFKSYPKEAYATVIESWKALPDDVIEFTIRRLPTAD